MVEVNNFPKNLVPILEDNRKHTKMDNEQKKKPTCSKECAQMVRW